jgi:Resolvase, N terminal domain
MAHASNLKPWFRPPHPSLDNGPIQRRARRALASGQEIMSTSQIMRWTHMRGSRRGTRILAGQIAEVQAAGCGNIFKEKASGAKTDRPELAKAIRRLDAGDVLVDARPAKHFRRGRQGRCWLSLAQGCVGRHDDAARPPDAHRARRACRVRTIADRCAHRRRPQARAGPWSAFRSAEGAHSASAAGSCPAAHGRRCAGRSCAILWRLAGDH